MTSRILKLLSGTLLALAVCQAVAATGFADRQSLLNRLSTASDVPVIVTFESGGPVQTGRTSRAGRSLAMPLRSRQDALLARLPKASHKHIKRFNYVPQMALSVDAQGLQQLLQDADIRVVEDKLRKQVLAQSVPRVFPGHKSSPHTGNGWAVAILDTGIDKNHPFLSGKVVSEACYSDGGGQPGSDSLCPGGAVSSTAPDSGKPCSSTLAGCAHGTFVAGVAAGKGGLFDGVARAGELIAIQVFSRIYDFGFCFPDFSCTGAYDSDIIAGLERVYALRNQFKIAAANLSLGGGMFSGSCNGEPHKPAIDMLRNAKIATVVATGNDGYSNSISSPACISSAIAVGSSKDTADVASGFSNSSVMQDLYAPGETITSSVPGGYANGTGTSFAAPHVAGAWAVLKQALPGASVNQIEIVLKSKGPWIAKGGVSRRRLDVVGALNELVPSDVNIAPILQLLLLD